jgi:hypothetical protein
MHTSSRRIHLLNDQHLTDLRRDATTRQRARNLRRELASLPKHRGGKWQPVLRALLAADRRAADPPLRGDYAD